VEETREDGVSGRDYCGNGAVRMVWMRRVRVNLSRKRGCFLEIMDGGIG